MGARSNEQLRLMIADEAARLVLEESIADYELARGKAARRYGVKGRANLPTPAEIDAAVQSRRSLFGLAVSADEQRTLLRAAYRWLKQLSTYSPRLVGGVAEGVMTPDSVLEIHLVADSVKEIAIDLLNRELTYQSIERPFAGTKIPASGFAFEDRGVPVELFVFGSAAEREALRDVRDGKALRGLGVDAVGDVLDRL